MRLLGALLVLATTFHVSTAGNNANPGTSAGAAKRNLANGMALLAAGDTLEIHAGTYSGGTDRIWAEDMTGNGASWVSPITITVTAGDTVTLNGNVQLIKFPGSQSKQYIIIAGSSTTSTPNFIIDGANHSTSFDEMVSIDQTHSHFRLVGLELKNAKAHMCLVYGDDILAIGCKMHDTNTNGNPAPNGNAWYGGGDYQYLQGCEIYNCSQGAIRFFDSTVGHTSTGCVATGNKIYNFGQAGAGAGFGVLLGGSGHKAINNIIIGGSGSNGPGVEVEFDSPSACEVYNNTIDDIDSFGIKVASDASGTIVRNNTVTNCSVNWSDAGSGTVQSDNNFTDNPLFVGGGDYHLQASSPLINAGVAVAVVAQDYAGSARPVGDYPDIGAYEFGGTPSVIVRQPIVAGSGSGLIYRQRWQSGEGSMMAGDYQESTTIGGGDGPDSVYAEHHSSEAVTVTLGTGPSSENALDRDTSLAEDYDSSGIALQDLPAREGGIGSTVTSAAGTKWWPASQGRMLVKSYWSTAAWDLQTAGNSRLGYYLMGATSSIFIGQGFNVSIDGTPGLTTPPTGVEIGLSASTFGDANYQDAGSAYATVTKARGATVGGIAIENAWQEFEIRWQVGTVTGSPITAVASDGYIRLYWNGELVIDLSNIDLVVNDGGDMQVDSTPAAFYAPIINHLRSAWIGYFGMFGPQTDLRIYSSTTAATIPTPPTPGSLIDNSAPCCTTAPPGTAVPGHVDPAITPIWYPSCTGGGQAASAADVTESEDWTLGGIPKHPDSWLTLAGPPSDSTASTTRWGMKPLSDRNRFVEGRLDDVGEIERGSSDKDGNYTPARLRIVQNDADASLRTLLADASERHWLNREARYDILSYEGRKADLTPRPLLQGRVVTTQPELERQGVIEIQDIVGSHYGPADPDRLIGLPIGDEHPSKPEGTKGKVYPIVFGEHSDQGSYDETGADVSKGTLPAIDCGDVFMQPLGAQFDTGLAPVIHQAIVNLIPGGDIQVTTYGMVAGVYGGIIGPPSTILGLNPDGNGAGGLQLAHTHRHVWLDAIGGADSFIVWMFRNPAFHPVTNPAGDTTVRYQEVTNVPTNPAFPPRSEAPATWTFYADFTSLTDGEQWGSQTTTAPRNLTAQVIGTPGTTRYIFAVSAITNLGETRPSDSVTVLNGPAVLTASNYIRLNWDPPAQNPDAVITYRVIRGTTDPPSNYLALLDTGSPIGSGLYGGGGSPGSPSVDLEYEDTGVDTEKPFNVSHSDAPADENTMAWMLCAIGAVDIHQIYGSNVDAAEGVEPRRVALDINAGDIIAPDSTDWPHENPYREIGGIRQTGFYARGTRLQHHRDGVVTFAWNGCGYQSSESPALLINQAYPMLLTLLNEFVEKTNGQGYRTGDFGPIEAFTDGTPKFWTTKFDAAQQATIDGMATPLGAIGKYYIGDEGKPLRDVLREFFTDFPGHLTTNHRGQMYPFVIDLTESSPPDGDVLRDRMEIIRLSDHRYAYDEVENQITVNSLYDHDAQEFRIKGTTFTSEASIIAHGGGKKGTFETAPKDCYWSCDSNSIAYRWVYHLSLYAYPPRYAIVVLGLAALERPNGDQVRFTHAKEGIGASGDLLTPGIVLATTVRVQPYEVEQTLRLLE